MRTTEIITNFLM